MAEKEETSELEACPECGGGLELYLDEQLVGRRAVVTLDEAGRSEIVEYEENPDYLDVFDEDAAWQIICRDCSEEICSH